MKRTPLDVPVEEVLGLGSDKDARHWEALEGILERNPHGVSHLLAMWPVYVRRINLARFLAHAKLFEYIAHLPGDIVELGVSRGVSFFTWHKLLEIHCPLDTSRKVIGFDSFEGLADFTDNDGRDDANVGKRAGGWSAGSVEEEVFALKDLFNQDNVLARERAILVKGRVQDTIEAFLTSRPGMRISLLHFDLDLYEPTLFALEALWDLLVPGGLIVLDEYALPPWAGETSAFDEFCRRRSIVGLKISKFPWSLTPTAFFTKP
jgi:hypothetical protein